MPRMLSAALLLLLLALGTLASGATTSSSSPTKLSLDDAIRNSLQVPTPTPTPTPSLAAATVAPMTPSAPQPTTYNNITSDMKRVIQAVGPIECPEHVRKNTFAIYKHNRALFDACTRASTYQLLPHEAGSVPTPAQTTALVTSQACVDLFSGIILANFPECDIDGFSVRSAAEALFRIRKDVLAGRGAPTQRQFDEFYSLNRVANVLAENATLIEDVLARQNTRVSLSEMARMVNRIDIDPAVTISANMTISIAASRSSTYPRGTSASSEVTSPVALPSSTKALNDGANSTAIVTKSAAASEHRASKLMHVLHAVVVVALCAWRS